MSYLIFDIETIPETELAKAQGYEPLEGEFPPLEMHKIVSVGMVTLDENFVIEFSASLGAGRKEEDLVAWFNSYAKDRRLVGFNSRGFDMPVIQLRALYHKIPLPWFFELGEDNYGKRSKFSKRFNDRYAGTHIDLLDEWTNYGASKRVSLSTLAKLCGLAGKTDVSGGDVYGLYRAGLHQTIDRYCLEDVYQTAIVFLRFLHLKGELTPSECRDRISRIIGAIDRGDHPSFWANLDSERLMP